MSVPLMPPEALEFFEARERLYQQPLRERSRAALWMSLQTLVRTTDSLAGAFDADPNNDDEFNRLNVELAHALNVASQCLDIWRASRDCDGEG